MIRARLIRWIDAPQLPIGASGISLVLGLFFTFVWAPHPWGWQGIDAYHELARALARGETFPTTDVPWGYAYYAAFFYAVFGERLWVPLVGQVVANAFVPLLLYWLAAPLAGRRTAATAALIVGIFSFNTVYASTQVSDAICTVLFLCALVAFSRGWRTGGAGAFALSGVLCGLVPQFRPNMVILPGIMILGYFYFTRRSWRTAAHVAIFSVLVAGVQLPWVVHNYRLTGMFLPTSTHGGVQLWYGTLQVGPYLESRAHNPRTNFESPAFDYSSLPAMSMIVDADYRSCFPEGGEPALVYWTDAHASPRRLSPMDRAAHSVRFEIPAQPSSTAVSYYFEERGPGGGLFVTPLDGAANPWIVFVDTNHLGDLDRHDDLLDIFDIGRMMRHFAWQEPLRAAAKLDLDGDGIVSEQDLTAAIAAVLPRTALPPAGPPDVRLSSDAASATLSFGDGSRRTMPRAFGGGQTDFEIGEDGDLAGALVSLRRTYTSIAMTDRRPVSGACTFVDAVGVNRVFYRREPHLMRRYMALAFDNISRDPLGFATASAYRMVRLFIILGTDDRATTQQFRGARLAYAVGTGLTTIYFAVFLAGAILAVRQRSALVVLLVPIVYVPLTICFVLTNMRYTVTVQPLMFVFVAVAVVAALRMDRAD